MQVAVLKKQRFASLCQPKKMISCGKKGQSSRCIHLSMMAVHNEVKDPHVIRLSKQCPRSTVNVTREQVSIGLRQSAKAAHFNAKCSSSPRAPASQHVHDLSALTTGATPAQPKLLHVLASNRQLTTLSARTVQQKPLLIRVNLQ